jgi:uncharacterized membrane protein
MTKYIAARHRRSNVPTLVVGLLVLLLVVIGVLVLAFLLSWVRGSMGPVAANVGWNRPGDGIGPGR